MLQKFGGYVLPVVAVASTYEYFGSILGTEVFGCEISLVVGWRFLSNGLHWLLLLLLVVMSWAGFWAAATVLCRWRSFCNFWDVYHYKKHILLENRVILNISCKMRLSAFDTMQWIWTLAFCILISQAILTLGNVTMFVWLFYFGFCDLSEKLC